MRRFKNKTEEMRYLLQPREVERKTNSKGETYRIYDDGNFKTFHIFTVEKLLCKQNGTEYWDRISKVFTDWKDASNKLNELCGN